MPPDLGRLVAGLVADPLRHQEIADAVMASGAATPAQARAVIADRLQQPLAARGQAQLMRGAEGEAPALPHGGVDEPAGAGGKAQLEQLKAAREGVDGTVARSSEGATGADGRPPATAIADSVAEAIRETAPMLPRGVIVRSFAELADLPERLRSALTEGGGVVREAATGRPVDALADRGEIFLAEYALSKAGRIAHEGVHALRASGQLTAKDVKVLAERARRDGLFGTEREAAYRAAYADRANVRQALDEEAAAHLIEARVAGTSFGREINGILDRIVQFLERLANLLRGAGFQTADDVARAIRAGEVARRPGRAAAGDGPMYAARADWGEFSDVEVALPRHGLRNADAALYDAAKAGDLQAGLRLVGRVLDDAFVARLRTAIGDRQPLIVAVHAEEATGRNSIPKAFALALAYRLGLKIEDDIVQVVRAQHTGAGAFERIARQAEFAGPVRHGREYLILDDTLTMGGTLAALRGYIEQSGGRVILGATLTGPATDAAGGGVRISPSPELVAAVKAKHPGIEEWWRNELGHPIEQATEGELQHARKALSLDAIRDRTAQGRLPPDDQGGGGLSGVGRGPQTVRRAGRLGGADDDGPLFALADAETGQSMRRDLDELGYYSRALEAARGLKQAKGTPEQMLAQLKRAGVKDAEIEATGLRPALEGRKAVTRDEIVRHLDENRIGLREVQYRAQSDCDELGATAADVKWQELK